MRARNSYLLALLSGALLMLSYPPFKFGEFLAWVALVPLLIPGPVSWTSITRLVPFLFARKVILPPLGVNLIALLIRLRTTWRKRSWSTQASGSDLGDSKSKDSPFCWIIETT